MPQVSRVRLSPVWGWCGRLGIVRRLIRPRFLAPYLYIYENTRSARSIRSKIRFCL